MALPLKYSLGLGFNLNAEDRNEVGNTWTERRDWTLLGLERERDEFSICRDVGLSAEEFQYMALCVRVSAKKKKNKKKERGGKMAVYSTLTCGGYINTQYVYYL